MNLLILVTFAFGLKAENLEIQSKSVSGRQLISVELDTLEKGQVLYWDPSKDLSKQNVVRVQVPMSHEELIQAAQTKRDEALRLAELAEKRRSDIVKALAKGKKYEQLSMKLQNDLTELFGLPENRPNHTYIKSLWEIPDRGFLEKYDKMAGVYRRHSMSRFTSADTKKYVEIPLDPRNPEEARRTINKALMEHGKVYIERTRGYGNFSVLTNAAGLQRPLPTWKAPIFPKAPRAAGAAAILMPMAASSGAQANQIAAEPLDTQSAEN